MTLKSIDLKKVNDHPGTLLRKHGSPGEISAELLRQYEDANGVTFAALDNDALADVRTAYDRLTGGDTHGWVNIERIQRDLLVAVDSLLGLDT